MHYTLYMVHDNNVLNNNTLSEVKPMKDFTLNIEPIVDDIKSIYLIDNNPDVCAYLQADLMMYKTTESDSIKTVKLIRHDEDFYISGIHSLRELFWSIEDFNTSVSTYAGELDDWATREKQRVLNAIRDELIKEFK